MTFVDSNVFIYAVDKAVSAKQKKARGIVADVFADGSAYRVSSQVLAEFSSVAIRKLGMATPILLDADPFGAPCGDGQDRARRY